VGTEERVVGAEEGILGSGQTGVMEAGKGVEGVGQGDVARARDGVFDSIKAPGAAEPDFSICIYTHNLAILAARFQNLGFHNGRHSICQRRSKRKPCQRKLTNCAHYQVWGILRVSPNPIRFVCLECLLMYIVLLFFNHDVIRVEFTSQDDDIDSLRSPKIHLIHPIFLSFRRNKDWTIYLPRCGRVFSSARGIQLYIHATHINPGAITFAVAVMGVAEV
jgi:hypothetical protein